MKKTVRSSANRSAFTLVELLLVLAILGVVMATVMPRLMGRQTQANEDATRISIAGLSQALKLYSLDHSGDLPSTGEGLGVLRTRPVKDKSWHGPYVERAPLDAWGSDFVYRYPGTRNPEGFDIVSPGPDRMIGTDDDIGNWEQ